MKPTPGPDLCRNLFVSHHGWAGSRHFPKLLKRYYNQKLWEIQKPFHERIFGRRRYLFAFVLSCFLFPGILAAVSDTLPSFETDYYRFALNPNGSFTITRPGDGPVILKPSPRCYLSYKTPGASSPAVQYDSIFDFSSPLTKVEKDPKTGAVFIEVTCDSFEYARIVHRYKLQKHSPYIYYTVTITYKKSVDVVEERFDFTGPGGECEIMTRDLKLIPLDTSKTYWSDLYTPRVIRFANGLYFPGFDSMDSMKVQAAEGDILVSFYSDYAANHPHIQFLLKREKLKKLSFNENRREVNDTHSASLYFAVLPAGESIPYVIKTRQPYGYNATFIFTTHPDDWQLDAARAIAYGTADTTDPRYGTQGIAGRGIGWTHGTFVRSQDYALENPNADIKGFIDRLYSDGVEIVPHTISWNTDSRRKVQEGLKAFIPYNSRNWIDHNAGDGRNNLEDLSAQGAVKDHKNYILDILDDYNYSYAWAYIDFRLGKESFNMLSPQFTDAIRPLLFYNNRIDHNPADSKKIYLWTTVMSGFKGLDYYGPVNIDGLIAENGVHITHEYLGRPAWSGKVFYNNNGKIEIYPVFDESLKHMVLRRAGGLLWSPTISTWADYLVSLPDVSIIPTPPITINKDYNQKFLEVQKPFYKKVSGGRRQYPEENLSHLFTISNNGKDAVTGLTLMAEKEIRSVTLDSNPIISFGGSYGEKEIVLPTLKPGTSATLQIVCGQKPSSFPTVVSNDTEKNKINEITAYWDNAGSRLLMTAWGPGGVHSFTVTAFPFAGRKITIKNITVTGKPFLVGKHRASSEGKVVFKTIFSGFQVFELTSPGFKSKVTLGEINANRGRCLIF